MAALVVQETLLVADENWADLARRLAQQNQDLSAAIRKLAKRPRHKREEKRLRQIARDAIQQELFERSAEELLTRKRADTADKPPRPTQHSSYPTPESFEPRLRAAIKEVWDPEQFHKRTIQSVCTEVSVSPNVLADLLKDYGYTRSGETLARCLRRLADEWHPEWRGINRQRF